MYWNRVALLISIFLTSGSSLANVLFSGTLNAPPACTIDAGNTIDIDFEDVTIKKIDGVKFKKTVPYTISCGPDTLPWELRLSINSTETDFEQSAIQSSVPGLGVRVLQNGSPFRLNHPLIINLTSPPILEAVPVKRAGVDLEPGGFTASATLLAEYQ